MKQIIIQTIQKALTQLVESNQFPEEILAVSIQIERTKDLKYGDFSSNIAMQLARIIKTNPMLIAQQINKIIEKKSFSYVSVAPPGFINFKLSNDRYNDLIQNIITKQSDYAIKPINKNSPKWLLEFISANPTGPLHVGHGRGAAYGGTLANILKANGINVFSEYYVNDAGRQMNILATSVYLRYLQLLGVSFEYPSNAYQAKYCIDIAQTIYDQSGDKHKVEDHFFNNLPITDYQVIANEKKQLEQEKETCEKKLTDTSKKQLVVIKEQLDKIKKQLELTMDCLIQKVKNILGENDYQIFFKAALDTILDDIKEDLSEFGVCFDNWYSERKLFDEKKIEKALSILEKNNYLYKKNGATWFKSTHFGDEKDRVVQRDNGFYTYFASDIAYHNDKLDRGFDYLIDLFGADHHGYIARVKAALIALGHDANKLRFEIVQFAVLIKNGQSISMSTRSGQYIALRELRQMIGDSAARFFYVMRKPQQHMDFDLDLAVSQSKDNPLYYIQYAHARVSTLLNKAKSNQLLDMSHIGDIKRDVSQLNNDYELSLFKELDRYQDVLSLSAKELAPHLLTNYLKELATALHSYYDAANIKFLATSDNQQARFHLLMATKQLLSNGLTLIGVDAPESM